MAEKVIKIALVDDHTLFRTGLRGLLSGREDFSVVADFGSGVNQHVIHIFHLKFSPYRLIVEKQSVIIHNHRN